MSDQQDTLAHAFKDYRRMVVWAEASPEQVDQIRAAFFAGATAALAPINHMLSGELTRELAAPLMANYWAECQTFVEEIKQRAAAREGRN